MKKIICLLMLMIPTLGFGIQLRNAPVSSSNIAANLPASVVTNPYNNGTILFSESLSVYSLTAGLTAGNFESRYLAGINQVLKLSDSANYAANRGVKMGFYVPTNNSSRLGAEISAANESTTATYLTFNTEYAGTVAERVRVAGNGNVGIATTNTTAKLTVDGTALVNGRLDANSTVYFNGLGTAGTGTTLVIDANKQIIPQTSSARFKENITSLNVNSDVIYELNPVEFDYKDNGGHAIGFIAEEMETKVPTIVNKDADGLPYSIRYTELIPVLVDALKKQKDIITSLEYRIQLLESK